MALEKVEKFNIFLRIRRFILGKEKPDLLTRASCLIVFIIWIYLISWQVLTFLSVMLVNTIEKTKGGLNGPATIKAAFQRVGSREYGFADTMNRLTVHSTFQLILFAVALVGIILVYRKKRLGFFLYIIPLLLTFLATYFILGWSYIINEVSGTDTILLLMTVIYFGIGLFLFYRKPNKPEVTNA